MKQLMVSDETHAALKAEAKKRGMVLKALTEQIIREALEVKP